MRAPAIGPRFPGIDGSGRRLEVVGLMLLAGVLGACRKGCAADDPFADVTEPLCATRPCIDIYQDSSQRLLGAWMNVRTCGPPIVVKVMWPFWQPGVHGFDAAVVARVGEIFPSHDGLVALLECGSFKPGSPPEARRYIPEYASVVEAPHQLAQDLALAPGNVFIPLNGEGTLDSAFVATAKLEGGTESGAGSSSVTVVHAPDPPVVHRELVPGGSFAWSDRTATVVRIVAPRPPHVAGWIEVKVSSPSDVGGT